MLQTPPETVRDLLQRYYETRKDKFAYPDTTRSHMKPVDQFFGDHSLKEIGKAGALKKLCDEYIKLHCVGISRHTVIARLTILRAALKWASKLEWIDGMPNMAMPEAPAPRQRRLSRTEFEALLDAADRPPTLAHLRAYTYLVLHTHQHVREILDMTWTQVDFDRRRMTYWRGLDKHEIDLNDRMHAALLNAYEKRQTKYIVEWRGSQVNDIYYSFRELLRRARIKDIAAADIRLSIAEGIKDEPSAPARQSEPQPSSKTTAQLELFISYSREDGTEYAKALHEAFIARGYACFLDQEDERAGKWRTHITRAVTRSNALVLVLTPCARESKYVQREVHLADNHDITVLMVVVDDTKPGEELEMIYHQAHYTPWKSGDETADKVLSLLKKAVR